jgi:hypothetical protein
MNALLLFGVLAPSDTKAWIEVAKSGAEIVAAFFALLFFLFKAISGYFVANLSVRIECSRQPDPGNETTDFLTVMLILSKGDLGSVKIHDIQIRNGNSPIEEMNNSLHKELWRLPHEKTQEKPTKIIWKDSKDDNRRNRPQFINLGPGEETQLAACCKVGRNEVCKVNAVLAGRAVWRPWTPACQWRISAVSLPRTH